MATEISLPHSIDQGTNIIQRETAEIYNIPRTCAPPILFDLANLLTAPTVLTTIYKFPTMEPLRFESYNSKHLHLPLRRDLLHRAVVFEGDYTRQGTASTKTRWEVHGSHAKIRPQKGTGKARLGTRQSPMLKGGGKSFGPHPRDFATQLPKKIYDKAWRTALSYRYRKGELIICENDMEIEYPDGKYMEDVARQHHWDGPGGRTLIITRKFTQNLFEAMDETSRVGRVMLLEQVDVKNLLEMNRVVIEKAALDKMLKEHQSDLP